MIEAALIGVIGHLRMAQMPLAYHGRLVAGCLEALCHESLVRMDPDRVPRHDDAVGHTEAHRIPTGHQRRAGRRADGRGVEAVERNSLSRETVERWSLDRLLAVKADVRPAEIVRQEGQDVRLRGLGRLRKG